MADQGLVSDVQKALLAIWLTINLAMWHLMALSLKDCINLIHDCGGKASLAHATRYNLTANKLRKLIADFASSGGDAVELPASNEPIQPATWSIE